MHRWMKRSLVTAFTVTASLASVFAFAGSSVTIALTADRLVETQGHGDGHTFESIPLMRKVKLDDGREVMREVPAAEYRFLRWSLGTLGAHGQQSVRARVRVSTGPVSAAQR